MDFTSAIIYGIVQGLTEFLPVSSSAHLALLPYVLKIDDPGIFFDLSMHLGTALAVIFYFRKILIGLIPRDRHISRWPVQNLNLFIACLATFVPVLLFKDFAEEWGRRPQIMAINLIVFGLIFWLADHFSRQKNTTQFSSTGFRPWWSLFMGLAQFISIFPGVSRSGITITAGLLSGESRTQAANFSFLMGLPVIIGGFFFKLQEVQGALDWPMIITGLVTSFVMGLLSIHLFLKLLNSWGALPFFIYRFILGIVLLLTF